MNNKSKIKNEFLEWLKAIIIAVILVSGIQFFLVAPVEVDGQSMLPTLNDGDRLLVNKIDYTVSKPKRFDVVVFHVNKNNDFIKRVIGLPGEHIAYQDDNLLIDGEIIDEPHLKIPKDLYHKENLSFTSDFTLESITEKSVIPPGYVFVLGDNRNASTDSRILGLVPISEIMGTTDFIVWPATNMGTVKSN